MRNGTSSSSRDADEAPRTPASSLPRCRPGPSLTNINRVPHHRPSSLTVASPRHTLLQTTTVMTAPVASDTEAASSKLVVHHLNDSRSQRILWLLVSICYPNDLRRSSADILLFIIPCTFSCVS